jgi:hypothetical protein
MKAYLGSGGMAPRIIDLSTRWKWAVSEKAPGIHWIGDWVGPRAGLDAVVKRKIHIPSRDSNPRAIPVIF